MDQNDFVMPVPVSPVSASGKSSVAFHREGFLNREKMVRVANGRRPNNPAHTLFAARLAMDPQFVPFQVQDPPPRRGPSQVSHRDERLPRRQRTDGRRPDQETSVPRHFVPLDFLTCLRRRVFLPARCYVVFDAATVLPSSARLKVCRRSTGSAQRDIQRTHRRNAGLVVFEAEQCRIGQQHLHRNVRIRGVWMRSIVTPVIATAWSSRARAKRGWPSPRR